MSESKELLPRKVHEGHWVENLYCKTCRKNLTNSEIFDMGFNWALDEMRSTSPKDLIDINEECAGVTGTKITLKWKER